MKVFLAFPFSNIINEETNLIVDNYMNFLKDIRESLLSRHFEVFLAHFREDWGKSIMTADECTPLDFKEMKDTDIVFAFPGSPISGGVHIELGWASAMNKKIVLFLDKKETYSPLVYGLSRITNVELFYFDNINDATVKEIIVKKVDKLSIIP